MRKSCTIGLVQPKHTDNIGGVLRAAECYDAQLVVYTGRRYKHMSSDVWTSYKKIPLVRANQIFDVVPHGMVPVAVEMVEGAQCLSEYVHPANAYYIFGPEDGTLGRATIDRCRDVVSVPTTRCMNLAATVNVVLYDRTAKFLRSENEQLLELIKVRAYRTHV